MILAGSILQQDKKCFTLWAVNWSTYLRHSAHCQLFGCFKTTSQLKQDFEQNILKSGHTLTHSSIGILSHFLMCPDFGMGRCHRSDGQMVKLDKLGRWSDGQVGQIGKMVGWSSRANWEARTSNILMFWPYSPCWGELLLIHSNSYLWYLSKEIRPISESCHKSIVFSSLSAVPL